MYFTKNLQLYSQSLSSNSFLKYLLSWATHFCMCSSHFAMIVFSNSSEAVTHRNAAFRCTKTISVLWYSYALIVSAQIGALYRRTDMATFAKSLHLPFASCHRFDMSKLSLTMILSTLAVVCFACSLKVSFPSKRNPKYFRAVYCRISFPFSRKEGYLTDNWHITALGSAQLTRCNGSCLLGWGLPSAWAWQCCPLHNHHRNCRWCLSPWGKLKKNYENFRDMWNIGENIFKNIEIFCTRVVPKLVLILSRWTCDGIYRNYDSTIRRWWREFLVGRRGHTLNQDVTILCKSRPWDVL